MSDVNIDLFGLVFMVLTMVVVVRCAACSSVDCEMEMC